VENLISTRMSLNVEKECPEFTHFRANSDQDSTMPGLYWKKRIGAVLHS
jgi:hypothetical protein